MFTITNYKKITTLLLGATLVACGTEEPGATDTGDTDNGSTGGATTQTPTTVSPTTGGDPTTGADPSDGDSTGSDPSTGDDGSSSGSESTGEPVNTAAIRVVHGSPGAPNVDVYVEGVTDPVITDLAYGAASDYLDVPEGDYNFLVRAAGSDPTEPPAFETGPVTLPAGASITALASGLLGSADPDDTFRVIPLVEEFVAAGAGEATVRIVHAGADAPTVDLDVGNDGSTEIQGLARFTDTGADGIAVPAGAALQVGILAGGEIVTAFTTPELPEGTDLFVIATGQLSALPREDSGFSLLALTPEGALPFIRQDPTVFAFHGSPDAPPVDICVGDVPLLGDVPFGGLGGVQVPPGEYELEFHAAPSDCTGEPASVQMTPMLEAGQRYLAVATGELTPEGNDPAFALAAFVDELTLNAAPIGILRAIHVASAPAVDLGLVTGGQIDQGDLLIEGLSFPDQSDELMVPAATYDVGIIPAGTALPTAPLVNYSIPVSAGSRTLALAVGALAPEIDEQPFSLYAIDTAVFPWEATLVPAN